MAAMTAYVEYGYTDAAETHSHSYVWPKLLELCPPLGPHTRVLDVGCGSGFNAAKLAERGCQVVGIDMSVEGIALARQAYPGVRFEVLPADDKLLATLNEPPFDLIVSTEVVEHLYDPRAYVKGCFSALRPGGRLVLSTPYHGYLKNLVLAVLGKWDSHASPLWDCGHIKLWSRKTLSVLLREPGFENLQFRGAGRLPLLWMSMVMSADRPM
jgi:2-polyprenyl-6-hydroxyphenyl methylase/3-demethylubiquinone-9 3-methyltransferase